MKHENNWAVITGVQIKPEHVLLTLRACHSKVYLFVLLSSFHVSTSMEFWFNNSITLTILYALLVSKCLVTLGCLAIDSCLLLFVGCVISRFCWLFLGFMFRDYVICLDFSSTYWWSCLFALCLHCNHNIFKKNRKHSFILLSFMYF